MTFSCREGEEQEQRGSTRLLVSCNLLLSSSTQLNEFRHTQVLTGEAIGHKKGVVRLAGRARKKAIMCSLLCCFSTSISSRAPPRAARDQHFVCSLQAA
jgi:hypothetical protein